MAVDDEKQIKLQTIAEKLEAQKKLFIERIKTLGPNDETTLAIEYDIAMLFFSICDYDKALELFKEVYFKRCDVLGTNHKDTIAAQSKVGFIYSQKDRLEEALHVYYQIYTKLCDCVLGRSHDDIQESLYNIGRVLQKLDKYDEAFETFSNMEYGLVFQYSMIRALRKRQCPEIALEFLSKIKEKLLKKSCPEAEILTAEFRIGKALAEAKNSEKALSIFKNIVKQRMESLGPFHKHTISALRHAGLAYYDVGEIDEGFKYLYEAHKIAKKILGRDHKKTLAIQADIGNLLLLEGKSNKALEVYKDIESAQTSNDPYNLDAIQTKINIGDIYCKKGFYSKAYDAYQLGNNVIWDYDEMVNLKNKMVYCLLKESKLDQFFKIHNEWKEEIINTFGPEDPRVLTAAEDIGVMYSKVKKYDDALKMLEDVYTKRCVILGIDHVDTLRTRQYMADVYAKNHNNKEALLAYRELIEVQKNLPSTMSKYYALTNLAAMFCLQGRYAESLLTYEERLGMKNNLEGRASTTNFEKNIIYTLAKEHHSLGYNEILNAFLTLRDMISCISKFSCLNLEVNIVIHNIVAKILQAQGLYDEALMAFEKVYELKKNLPSLDPDSITVQNAISNTGNVHKLLGNTTKALGHFEEMYEKLKSTVGPEDLRCLSAQLDLTLANYFAQKTNSAFFHYLDMYRKIKKKMSPEHPHHLQCEKAIDDYRSRIIETELVKTIVKNDIESFVEIVSAEISRINDQDDFGFTPLHHAAERGSIEFVRHLIQLGAFHDIQDKTYKTPLDYASSDEIANLLYQVDSFFVAVQEGDSESVAKIIKDEIFLKAKDKEGNAGLHWACKKGHVPIVQMLLNRKANIHLKNENGKTALDIAASEGNTKVLDIFKQIGESGPEYLSDLINENGRNTALHLAARGGNLEILKLLLFHKAEPTELNDHGYTPLHFAAYGGHKGIVEELLNQTDKIKLKNFIGCTNNADGLTALQIASMKGFTEIAELLAEAAESNKKI